MSMLMSESEIRAECNKAGRTCKTETGCTCSMATSKPLENWVSGPTGFGSDNPFGEEEGSMLPPAWLGRLLLAFVVVVVLLAGLGPAVWNAKP